MAISDLPEAMRSKIEVHPISDCWNWTGSKNPKGYGSVTAGTRGKSMLAHRKSYELLVGPIPEGLTIDHLCRNTSCQNPDHMEPVTRAENNTRRIESSRDITVERKPRSPEERAADAKFMHDLFEKHWGHLSTT